MNLAHDKKLHFAVGFIICAVCAIAGYAHMGLVLAIAAGLIKEIYDLAHPLTHTADVMDFVATVVGGSAAYLLFIILF